MPRKKTFEQALEELETIVKEMEQGNLPLEQAVQKYEQGVKQSKFCLDLLEKTEQKMTFKSEGGGMRKYLNSSS